MHYRRGMVSELELRTCGRAGCRWPAAASLSFRYETRQVWLLDLAAEPHPALYDLCPHHADALTVPRGWERVDQRVPQEAMREPSGHDLEARLRATGRPLRVGANRYAALSEELPRLAEEHGLRRDGPGADAAEPAGKSPGAGGSTGGGDATSASAAPAAEDQARPNVTGPQAEADAPPPSGASGPSGARESPRRRALPSRELSPMPVDDVEAPEPADGQARPAEASQPVRDGGGGEHPGQLAIPVDELDEAPAGEAIVVSIEEAGARRRGTHGS